MILFREVDDGNLAAMIVFLLSAVPLFGVWMLTTVTRPGRGLRAVVTPLLIGLATWALFYVIYLVVQGAVEITYSWGGLYGYYLFHHTGFPFAFAVLGFLVFLRRQSSPYAVIIYCSAFFGMLAIHDVIAQLQVFDPYILVLLPFIRIVLIMLFTAVWAASGIYEPVRRYLLTAGVLLGGALCGLIPMFYYHSYRGTAFIVTALLVGGAGVWFWYACSFGRQTNP